MSLGLRIRVAARALACLAAVALSLSLGLSSCVRLPLSGKPTIVVTYSIMGAVVKDLVGDAFRVVVSIPDGLDPREWQPSAKDIEAIDKAALVVRNGLGLEEGMSRALDAAEKAGVKVFTATDHVALRSVGTEDPHIWTDPVTMRAVADALCDEIQGDFRVDLSKRRDELDSRYDELDAEVAAAVAKLPPERRKLATGHGSMGYFAQRYGFKLVDAPSLSGRTEASAADLAALKKILAAEDVRVFFAEFGEDPKVALALSREAGTKTVLLTTHALPKGGGYAEFVRGLAATVVKGLEP
jgi:zinc/manganese transport system substrate-binding protein